MLKGLGLLAETGEPTQRYYDFLDQTQSKKIIAIGIQEAYEDLFNLNKDAQNLSQDEVKNKLKTLTQGQKSESVIDKMARTFRTLCDYADWSEISTAKKNPQIQEAHQKDNTINANDKNTDHSHNNSIGLHYNIQIYLPETTNMAVYDAIFQSLKKHLF